MKNRNSNGVPFWFISHKTIDRTWRWKSPIKATTMLNRDLLVNYAKTSCDNYRGNISIKMAVSRVGYSGSGDLSETTREAYK